MDDGLRRDTDRLVPRFEGPSEPGAPARFVDDEDLFALPLDEQVLEGPEPENISLIRAHIKSLKDELSSLSTEYWDTERKLLYALRVERWRAWARCRLSHIDDPAALEAIADECDASRERLEGRSR